MYSATGVVIRFASWAIIGMAWGIEYAILVILLLSITPMPGRPYFGRQLQPNKVLKRLRMGTEIFILLFALAGTYHLWGELGAMVAILIYLSYLTDLGQTRKRKPSVPTRTR